jgi:Lon protease-like protein
MKQQMLPLFPLSVVLFPRTTLPLHIFEDRYKQMIGDVMEDKSEFGVVLAGEKGICNSGCTAVVDKVLEQYPDGRLDLLAIGRRRFEILTLDDDKPYLRGEVSFFDDEEFDQTAADLRERVIGFYKDMRDVAEVNESIDAELDDPQLSFQLAQPVSDLHFRQLLLATRSEAARMKQLAEFLPSFISRQRQVQHARTVGPRNGHARWPSSL